MDKVQAFLAVLKKQHFWVLCGIILIASTVVWMMAVGNVESEASQNLQRIQASLQDAKQVLGVSQHPNEQIIAAYNQQTESLKLQVFQVWDALYKKQRATVLQWPPALGEGFIKHVDNTQFLGDIPVDFRDIYFNYVKTRWAELPGIIKSKPVAMEGAAPAANVRQANPDYIVVWDDQERIRKQLFSNLRPTTEWVWLTQEDLWIYGNLLNVIKQTNQGAIGPHNAVISTIVSMDVGKSAARDAGGTSQRIAFGGEGEAAAESSSASAGDGAAASGLLNGRYVNAVGLPLENGLAARDDEYKRIPVRLILRMDSTEIPQLILSCANAPLPVEVQQVRINVNSGGKDSSVWSPDLSPEDRSAGRKKPHVEVAMQGVIYIFNPPNREKLKLPVEEPSAGSAAEAFATEAGAATPTPTFDEDPAAATTPMPMDPAAAPAAEATPTTDPTAPAAEATTPPAETVTPDAATPAAPAPAAPATPAADAGAPAAENPKSDDLENLFKDDAEAAPAANP